MKKIRLLYALMALMFMAGCSIPVEMGRPVTMADVQTIVKDMTVQQVKNQLGEPMAVGQDKDGNQTLTWFHLRAVLPAKSGAPPAMQRVTITMSPDGRVLAVAYDMSNPAK